MNLDGIKVGGLRDWFRLTERRKEYSVVFLVYLIISLVMFWNLTLNITSYVVNGGGDVFQSLWNLWWTPYSVFVLHQSPYTTNVIFYPVGANLVSQTMTPLAGIVSWPFQQVSMPFAYNVLFFTSFALGGLFMFLLAEHVVRSRYAAFIAGLIFAFSPMHIAQSYSHLQWTIIEFIPLFVLLFLLMLKNKKRKYAILAALSFVLLTFMGDIQQGIIAVVFAVISLVILAILDRREVLNINTAINLALLGIFVLIIGSPFFAFIIPGIRSSLGTASQLSDIAHNMLYSDNLASFFLPSYYNGIFNGFSHAYYNQTYGLDYNGTQYKANVTEKTSYIGYSVLFLVAFGVYGVYKRHREGERIREELYWAAILLVFILLSLGPVIVAYTSVTGVPALYALYRDVPLFNLVREPGRFDVIVTVALAVLAAIGFGRLEKTRGKDALMLVILFSALILVEYNGMPLTASLANSAVRSASIPKAYHELGQSNRSFTLLVLPALPDLNTGSYLYPGMAMYYQTAAHKPLVDGYTTRMNATEELLLENVPLIVSASYLASGQNFIFPYPISENYTNLTLIWLAEYNVSFVAITRSAYTQQEQESLLSYMNRVFGSPAYQDSNVSVFSTTGAEAAGAGRSITSYIVGTWYPGYAFCASYSNCNQTFASLWWGGDVRGLNVFSPNVTKARIYIEATAYNPGPLYVLQQGEPLTVLNLSTSINPYALNTTLARGFNEFVFYQKNGTAVQSPSPYLNFGVRNITVMSG